MKKIFAFILTASLLSGCGEASKQDLKDANQNLKEASVDLKEAVTDANEEAKIKATSDWQKFKSESDSTMTAIDKQVMELKDKIANTKNKEKAKLIDALDKLEQRRNEQQAKLDQKKAEFETDIKTFNETVANKYESFKREFKHDTDELSTALKDQLKDNVK